MRKLVPAVLLFALTACATRYADRANGFERELDELRRTLLIPGMSAAIVKDQKIVWMRGFGYADVENRVPAAPDTRYHIASVTKTLGSTLIMQLVEQGQLSLDEPIAPYTPSRYSGAISDPRVQIRHVLSHTSAGTPGDGFAYDGARYGAITAVIERKHGAAFRDVVTQRILEPLQMTESVPGHDVMDDSVLARRYAQSLARLARPYAYYGKGEIVAATYPGRDISASAGLLSTVRDLAKYDIAIDRHVLLQPGTQELAWSPPVSNKGERLPYGLGWFTEVYRGERLIWHSGNWGSGFSALYFKVPARNISLILLANSEGLADGFWVPGETNPFACAFLRHFVLSAEDSCKGAAAAEMNEWLSERAARYEPAVALDEEALASYAGEYRLSETRTIVVTREASRLFINIPTKRDRLEMFASAQGDFFFKVQTPTRVRFVREAGRVTGLEFTYGPGEETTPATKIR